MKRLAGFVSAAALALSAIACGQTDAGITTAVKSKLAADDTVKAYRIDVDTSNKVVTLTGEVTSSAAKEQAVMIARNTDGVSDVIDQLRVSDTAATTGVDIDRDDVDVDVNVSDDLKREAGEAGNALERGARKAGDAIERGAEKTGNAIERGARKAGDAISDAADDDTNKDGK